MENLNKKSFLFWISKLNEIKEWILDAEFIAKTEDIEGSVARTFPEIRTNMQKYMEDHPNEITEKVAESLHEFDMYMYKHIEDVYIIFSEFYWRRSESNPPKSHWWWWLDEYFEGKIEINPDDVWIKWEGIKARKSSN